MNIIVLGTGDHEPYLFVEELLLSISTSKQLICYTGKLKALANVSKKKSQPNKRKREQEHFDEGVMINLS